ncbi:MAG: DUF488 family protein [Desulfomonilia bacterium]
MYYTASGICIEIVIDVRKIARSGHNSQFSEDILSEALERHDIMYKHMEGVRNFICKCRSWLMFQGTLSPNRIRN